MARQQEIEQDPETTDQELPGAKSGNGARSNDTEGGDEETSFKVYDRRFWQLDQSELEADAPGQHAPTYIERLEAQLAEKDQQLKDYIAAYKKEVVEELDQTKARLERDAAQNLMRARAELAEPMLEVLEAIERSVHAAEASDAKEGLLSGVQMVHTLMIQKLRDMGLSRVETVGTRFDPKLHDAVAIASVDDPAKDGVITAEFSAGFALEERVFRPAKVQVGKYQESSAG